MENKRYVKQVMILNKERHQEYLKDFFEEYLNFEGFVNFMLSSLYDEDRFVEEIIPNNDFSKVLIVYKIKI
jgi:prenyltransferase beta subunit